MQHQNVMRQLGAVVALFCTAGWVVFCLKSFGFGMFSTSVIVVPFLVIAALYFQDKFIYLLVYALTMPSEVYVNGRMYPFLVLFVPAWALLLMANLALGKKSGKIPKEWWVLFAIFAVSFASHPTSPAGIAGGKSSISGFMFDFSTMGSLVLGVAIIGSLSSRQNCLDILVRLPKHFVFWAVVLTVILFCMFILGIERLPLPGWNTDQYAIRHEMGTALRINAASGTGALVYAFGVAYFSFFKSRLRAFSICALGVLIVLWAGGRGGIISVGLFTLFALALHKRWKELIGLSIVGFSVLLIPFVAPSLFGHLPSSVQRALTIVGSSSTEAAIAASQSAELRLEFLQFAINKVQNHLLLGSGPFQIDLTQGQVITSEDVWLVYSYYHGVYISALSVYGLPFLLLVVALMIVAIRRGVRAFKSSSGQTAAAVLFFSGLMFSRAVTALTGGTISKSWRVFMYWAVLWLFYEKIVLRKGQVALANDQGRQTLLGRERGPEVEWQGGRR